MRQRIEDLIGAPAPAVGTFHSIALGWLRADGRLVGVPVGFPDPRRRRPLDPRARADVGAGRSGAHRRRAPRRPGVAGAADAGAAEAGARPAQEAFRVGRLDRRRRARAADGGVRAPLPSLRSRVPQAEAARFRGPSDAGGEDAGGAAGPAPLVQRALSARARRRVPGPEPRAGASRGADRAG